MPNKRITDLDPINVLDNADLLYIVDNESNQSNKITYGNLAGNSLLSLETDLNTLSGTVNLVRSDITYLSGTIDQIEAGAGDNTVGVMLVGKVREDRLIIDGSAAGVGITDAIKDSLRTMGIIVESAEECAALDNQ